MRNYANLFNAGWPAVALAAGAFWVAGCAGAHFKEASSPSVNGIRYYRPATYILIKPDYTKNTANITLWNGPDTSVPYAIDPYAYLATNSTDIEFDGGMLSKLTSNPDSTKFATDAIQAAVALGQEVLTTAANVAAKAALAQKSTGQAPAAPPPAPVFLFVASSSGFHQLYPPSGAASSRCP